MTVKARSYLVRKLVKFLVNNARKGACSYRAEGFCIATHRRELGLWTPPQQASPVRATTVYLTGFSGEGRESGGFPRILRRVFACRPLELVGTLSVSFTAHANGVGASSHHGWDL